MNFSRIIIREIEIVFNIDCNTTLRVLFLDSVCFKKGRDLDVFFYLLEKGMIYKFNSRKFERREIKNSSI